MKSTYRRVVSLLAIGLGLTVGARGEPVVPRETIRLVSDAPDGLAQFDTWLVGQGLNSDTGRVFRMEKDEAGHPVLRVTGEGFGGLITKQAYRDYRLVAEFRWTGRTWGTREKKARDNGLLLHCTGSPGNLMSGSKTNAPAKFESPWMKSVELQIIEGGVGDLLVLGGWTDDGRPWPTTIRARFGKDRDGEWVYDPAGGLRPFEGFRLNWWGRDPDWKDVVDFRGRQDVESPMGEWTRAEAVVRGGDFTYYVNGKLVNEASDCDMTGGRILIQTEGAEIVYRRIDLEPLTAAVPEAYVKLWSDPAVARRIEQGIEANRRGDAVLRVLGSDGRPLAAAEVEVRHVRHEFLFGCNLFALGQLATPELNRRYEAAFTGLFNFATIPFYWRELEPQEGKPRFAAGSEPIWRRPPPDVLVAWCASNGITPKGHALMYAKTKFMPDWTARTDAEAFRRQGAKHMAEIAARYGAAIPIWDAVNEELPRRRNPQEWPAVPDDYLAWCFREADRLFPRPAVLMINDGTSQAHGTTDEYMALVKGLQDSGVRVDGIGIQFHAYNRSAMLKGETLTPAVLFDVYERIGRLGLPLYITEITIPGAGDAGPDLQAAIVENLYRLWFATPRMAGLTWWNLGDGTAYENENRVLGGLLDDAMLPKPACRALDRLVNRDWRTHAVVATGADGTARFRGFRGKYSVHVRAGDTMGSFEFDLTGGESRAEFRLDGPAKSLPAGTLP